MTKLLSLKAVRVWACLGGALLATQLSFAQTDPSPLSSATPLDDFTEREVVQGHQVLAHQPVREADILWEKRLWRIIDVREKMNQPENIQVGLIDGIHPIGDPFRDEMRVGREVPGHDDGEREQEVGPGERDRIG